MNHNNSLDMILKLRIIGLVFKGGVILHGTSNESYFSGAKYKVNYVNKFLGEDI